MAGVSWRIYWRPHSLKLPLQMTIENFHWVEDSSNPNLLKSVGENGEDFISIVRSMNIEKDEADKKSQDSFFLVHALYEPQQSPYPDQVSKVVKCTDEPKNTISVSFKDQSGWTRGLLAFANDRRLFGICDESQYAFRALYLFVYCKKQKSLYEIKFFKPYHQSKSSKVQGLDLEFEKFIQSLDCLDSKN